MIVTLRIQESEAIKKNKIILLLITPAVKEPVDLLRSDGERRDGLTQISWQAGKCMTSRINESIRNLLLTYLFVVM